MKTKLVVIAASALVLALIPLASEAAPQHRASAHSQTRHLPQALTHSYGYAPNQAPQTSRSSGDVYQSDAQGHQSYSNPDRDFFGYNRNTY